jgi:trehalose/maltose hydrolase-like predicted phosphorylase
MCPDLPQSFDGRPWTVRGTAAEPGVLKQVEWARALSDGHRGLRGTLDDGEAAGTRVASLQETP